MYNSMKKLITFPFSKQSQRSSKYKDYVEVPEEQMGVVIGKGHRGLQQISTNTGAYVFTKREVSNRVFLQADKEDAIERAKKEISRIVVSCHYLAPTLINTV